MLQDRGVRSEIIHSPDGDPPSAFMSLLSAAKCRSVVRITGGCANMSIEDGQDLIGLFQQAFRGFEGGLLIGGTSMVLTVDMSKPVLGITEVGPAIRRGNPSSVLLGVISRTESISWNFESGQIVIERSAITDPLDCSETTTVVNPNMDAVVVLGKRITNKSVWHDEAVFCARVTEVQRMYAKWSSALIVYNGGETTDFEARLIAEQGWPVVLVKGSGRAADELASDQDFLARFSNVIVCDKEAAKLRLAMVQTGVIDPPPAKERLRAVS